MGKILGPGGQPVQKPKTEERKIPEDLLKQIKDKSDKRNDIFNEFMQVSLQRANAVKKEAELLEKMKNNGQSLQNRIENAFKKMKLKDEKNYNWRFDGNNAFIGIPRPKRPEAPKPVKPKVEEKPKEGRGEKPETTKPKEALKEEKK